MTLSSRMTAEPYDTRDDSILRYASTDFVGQGICQMRLVFKSKGQDRKRQKKNAWQTHEPRASDICQAIINLPPVRYSEIGALVRVSGKSDATHNFTDI